MKKLKKDLRIFAKNKRKNLQLTEISDRLTEKIRKLPQYKKSNHIMIYYPKEFEINLLKLLEDNKNFYLPKVKGNELQVCPFDATSKLDKSDFNIQEPCTEPISPQILDLIIVPALMADSKGYRLGYGKGFYDRFLKKNNIQTICAIPKELLTENLPHEDFDIKMDIIVTA